MLKFRSSDNLFTLWRASPSGFLLEIHTYSDRSREFPDTSCSSVADGSRQSGGPFILRNGAGSLRSAADSRFSFTGSFLDADRTRSCSSPSSETAVPSGQTRGSSSSSPSSWVLDMLIFAPKEKKLHVSSGEQIAHVIWAGTQDSPTPTHYVPLWSTQLEMSTSPKLDM